MDSALPGNTAPEPPEGLRERKKRETRDALLAAARRRFAAEGYAEARLADIAADAGVSDATLFRYFDSKADLALARVKGQIDDAVAALVARPADESLWDAAIAVIDSPAGQALGTGELVVTELQLLFANHDLVPEVILHLLGTEEAVALDAARRLGVEPSSLEAHLAAYTLLGGLAAVVRTWAANPAGPNLLALARDTFTRLRGLAPG